MEEALHKSEALFRAISEQIPDSLFLLDLEDPDVHVKIIYANEAASVMHGYPLEEIIGRSIAFLNDPVTTEKMPGRVERLLAGETLVFEGVHRRKDDTVFPVEVTSRMIDYSGRKVAVALDRDISERKRAEEALKLKVEQLDALNRASRAVTAFLELDQVLAEIVSLAGEVAATDYTSVMLVDECGHMGQSAENVPGVLAIEYRMRDGGLTSWIVRSRQAVIVDEIGEDGAIIPYLGEGAPRLANPHLVKVGVKSLAGLPLMAQDRLLGVLYLYSRRPNAFRDLLTLLTAFANQVAIAIENARLHEQARREIAERQRAEAELQTYAARLERSNRELESFAYIASHDLKEPLRKIQAFGDRLQAKYGEVLNEQGRDYLIRIQSAAIRMQALIDGLLIYSRVTTKTQPFVPVDLNAVVREVLADLEVRIEQLAAQVEVEDLPTIEADPLQMRQLFQNLIGNALKFHRQNVVPLVRVRRELLDGGEGQYRITVEDNGIGFDEKYLDRLFQVFQRLHGRSEYEGTGMGLAICRKIVERHGGHITARGVPGQGAAFIVTLPAKQPAKENP